jgi:hypothetical protein
MMIEEGSMLRSTRSEPPGDPESTKLLTSSNNASTDER